MLCKGWGRWRTAAAAVLLVLSASLGGLIPGVVQARGPVYLAPADTIAMAQLPAQGRSMIGLIYQGGPFRHEKDGVVFGNRERLLPAVSYTHLRAHETDSYLVCRLL